MIKLRTTLTVSITVSKMKTKSKTTLIHALEETNKHPRVYNPNINNTISFRSEDFKELSALKLQNNQGFRSVFHEAPPMFTSKDSGYEYLRDLRAYLQAYTPKVKELQIRDVIIERRTRRSRNAVILFGLLFSQIAQRESSRNLNEDLIFFISEDKHKSRKTLKRHKEKHTKKEKYTTHPVREDILDKSLTSEERSNLEEINNIIDKTQGSKYLNNPKFVGRMHYNKALILDNTLNAKYRIIPLDSGSAGNSIGSNLLKELKIKKYINNKDHTIQLGETITEIKE
ncbi:hypothetical protein BCR36DRAFT_413125 [Piromyces finnis]|uniref:Uncharacterized protein n=1 Tax=Piromyces finnis TaxID=1754191 RepID=A0A1Y1V7Z3_9FUNG|nr:hypothetical protein BCR36DRAFT_413125 [Piromyces finnis]|eukprot:ORX48721.1 hypothetical protein BCR36DRAFT_413125 [Piromyces finnis]